LSAIPDPKCQYPVPGPGQDANCMWSHVSYCSRSWDTFWFSVWIFL